MCNHCGCSGNAKATVTDLKTGESVVVDNNPDSTDRSKDQQEPANKHALDGPDRLATLEPGDAESNQHQERLIRLERDLLAKNNLAAQRNRSWFSERKILALNLVSSPGAGKTTLLERTIRELGSEFKFQVIEGDQATSNDAEKIEATGCAVVQVNTGTGCHLEADMVARGVLRLDPPARSILLIENVGNLVCPALFDLGEEAKVVVTSVTEGDDKPIKYPHIFRASELVVLNKIDLQIHVQFELERFLDCVAQVNPNLRVLKLSATTGEGLEQWYDWVRQRCGHLWPA